MNVGKKHFHRIGALGCHNVKLLLKNAAVADDIFRMGLAESPDCSCGEGRERVEFVIGVVHWKLMLVVSWYRRLVASGWIRKLQKGLNFDLHTILNPLSNPKLNSEDSF